MDTTEYSRWLTEQNETLRTASQTVLRTMRKPYLEQPPPDGYRIALEARDEDGDVRAAADALIKTTVEQPLDGYAIALAKRRLEDARRRN